MGAPSVDNANLSAPRGDAPRSWSSTACWPAPLRRNARCASGGADDLKRESLALETFW